MILRGESHRDFSFFPATGDPSGLANKIPVEHCDEKERKAERKKKKKPPHFYSLDWCAFIFDWLRARAPARLCLQPFTEFHVFPVRLGFPRLRQMYIPRALLSPSFRQTARARRFRFTGETKLFHKEKESIKNHRKGCRFLFLQRKLQASFPFPWIFDYVDGSSKRASEHNSSVSVVKLFYREPFIFLRIKDPGGLR